MLNPDTHCFTFAIVGDTHVKPETGDQSAPWKVNDLATGRARWISREIVRYAPRFIVHMGDLVHPVPELPTFDSAVDMTKSIFQGHHNRLHIIPGNHDIGDKPNRAMPAKTVRDEWIVTYENNFGPAYSSFDIDGVRIVLINNPVLNSGLVAEQEQRKWLVETLASAGDHRIFLFMHYPLFLLRPDEPGNYDNIDEPARSDFLNLIRAYRVEAVFAGHVHNIFYHRIDETEFYVMPATSFVRQDFAEMYRIEAVHENGRNDSEKLGFAIVDVFANGHAVQYLRSYGKNIDADKFEDALAPRNSLRCLPHPKKAGGAPIGVFLRHPWAEIITLPYNGPMDEFLRKEARNDYPVATLWRLGIRHMRVPVADLINPETRKRILDLVAIGHRFTVFTAGVPQGAVAETLLANQSIINRLECVLPADRIRTDAAAIRKFQLNFQRPIILSRIATSADDRKSGSRIELFVAHGHRPDQLSEIETLLQEESLNDIEGFVIRADLGADLVSIAAQLVSWNQKFRRTLDLHLRIAANNPAVNVTDEVAILSGIVEAYATALAYPNLNILIDTFMDIDRGYFVRFGLIDRRCNLRKSGLAVEALTAFFGDLQEQWIVSAHSTNAGRMIELVGQDYGALILLPANGDELAVDNQALKRVGIRESRPVTIYLDEPWCQRADLGTESVAEDNHLPDRAARPVLIFGRREN